MKDYSIRQNQRPGEDYKTMIVIDNETDNEIAEYRLTPGSEKAEIQSLRRSIDRHLEDGGTLGNYQW